MAGFDISTNLGTNYLEMRQYSVASPGTQTCLAE